MVDVVGRDDGTDETFVRLRQAVGVEPDDDGTSVELWVDLAVAQCLGRG
jgi:hypothetical protein